MKKKVLSFIIICLLISCDSKKKLSIEYNSLNIDNLGQEGCHWCWASTLSMIHNHYYAPVTQKVIAQKYINEIYNNSGRSSIYFSQDCNFDCPNKQKACDATYFCSKGVNSCDVDITISELKSLSTKFNIQTREVNPTFENIKNEIDSCHPFFINNMNSHIMVGKGYIDLGKYKFVLVNDPWRPCYGSEYALSSLAFQNNNSVMRIKNCIFTFPKSPKRCTNNKKTINSSNFRFQVSELINSNKDSEPDNELMNNLSTGLSEIDINFKEQTLGVFKNSGSYKVVDIYYISNYNRPNKNPIIGFYDPKNPCTLYIYEKIKPKGSWEILMIEKNSFLCCGTKEFEKIVIPNIKKTIDLINGNIKPLLIRNPENNLEVFRFVLNDIAYVTPTRTYSNVLINGKPFAKGLAIEETFFNDYLTQNHINFK